MLKRACGVSGERAATLLPDLKSISVDWETAYAEFSKESLPRYSAATETTLPNTQSLSEDSLGALVSLIYNRGAPFEDPRDRYLEMRHIKEQMGSKQFTKIPAELRSMRRLWRDDRHERGVLLRRDAEASLCEIGLASPPA